MPSCAARKKAKLQQLLQFKAKLPAHSQSALAAILEEVKKAGAPELHSSNHQKAARQLLLKECHGGSLGSLIQEAQLYREDGTSTTFHYANLLVYLATVYNQGGSMFELIQRQHQASASSIDQPWGLIIYCDEVVPGNILGRAERKAWCIYCTIAQFQDHLGQESAWLTISVERSTFVSTGVAQMMAKVLHSIFGSAIVDPRLGFKLKNPHGNITLYLDFHMVLADGAAQKLVWSSKGDSGTRYCILCSNVHASRPTNTDEEPDDVHCGSYKYSQLQLVTDQDLLDSYQRLHARHGTCTKKEFAQWQQATGLSYSKYALMLEQDLLSKNLVRPASQFCHDWMHGILQGTAPVVIHHCLQAIAQTGFEVHQFLERYYQLWQYPKSHKCQYIHTLFQKKKIEKNKKAQKFSCTASECLAIFPVMRHFLETIIQPQGLCPKEVKSFLAMALVIDQCHGGIQWKTTTRSSLLAAVEDCNQSFSEAFPEATMIRKWQLWQVWTFTILFHM